MNEEQREKFPIGLARVLEAILGIICLTFSGVVVGLSFAMDEALSIWHLIMVGGFAAYGLHCFWCALRPLR